MVDTVLELPGDGTVVMYNGGYSDYIAVRILNEKQQEKPRQTKDVQKETREKPKKLKFSFKEQQEYNTIDDDIAAIESKIAEAETKLEESATDYMKLQEIMDEKQNLEVQLEEKMNRWIYLNDLKELIENQN
ncbi:hypothetical protein DSECCO2_586630 [anaerobic digester metagenome]